MHHRNPYEPPSAQLDVPSTARNTAAMRAHWKRALWAWLALLVLLYALVSPSPQGVFGAVGCASALYFARLKKSLPVLLCIATMVALGFAMATSMQAVGVGVALVYFSLLLLCHISLGRAASAAGRSWVLFGALPFVWPLFGAGLSLAVLRLRRNA